MLTTIGWTTTLYWLTRRWLRQRIAWQWWQQQQSLQRHHTAESIRDGLLQQTFGFRHYLESTAAAQGNEPAEASQAAHWLTRMQALYQSLESLSNELSPPFVEDSLPLALQFAIKNGHWRRFTTAPSAVEDLRSASQTQLHLPESWPHNSPQQNQIVLSVTMELLAMTMPERNPDQTLEIALQTKDNLHTLILTLETMNYHQIQAVTDSAELRHLKEIFHSLAGGRLETGQTGKALIGRLSWPKN